MTGQDFLALSNTVEEIKSWIEPYSIELEINEDVEIQSSSKEESYLKIEIDGYKLELMVKDSYVYINHSDTSCFELLSEAEFWKQMYFASNSQEVERMKKEKTIKDRIKTLKNQNVFLQKQHSKEDNNIKRCLLNAKIKNNNKTITNLQWVLEG